MVFVIYITLVPASKLIPPKWPQGITREGEKMRDLKKEVPAWEDLGKGGQH